MQDDAVTENAVLPHHGVGVEQAPRADPRVLAKITTGANHRAFADRGPSLDHSLGLHAGTGCNLGGRVDCGGRVDARERGHGDGDKPVSHRGEGCRGVLDADAGRRSLASKVAGDENGRGPRRLEVGGVTWMAEKGNFSGAGLSQRSRPGYLQDPAFGKVLAAYKGGQLGNSRHGSGRQSGAG